MSKLIYSCVFFRKEYLDLLNLLLESFSRHDISKTKYLVIASPRFRSGIQDMFDAQGIDGDIWCLNDVYTQFGATCARLRIFSYPELHNYATLLYLDTDILITNPLEPIFDIELKSDKLYCHNQDITLNDWGKSKQLFIENDCDIDFERTVFTTGIMLFNNSIQMKELFSSILTHIEERIPGDYDLDGAYEEDFVIYQCFIQDCYDDMHLTKFTRNNCLVEDKDMILNHFCAQYKVLCATPEGKLDRMQIYLINVNPNKHRNIIHIGANKGDCLVTKATQYEPYHSITATDNCIFIEPIPYLFKQLKENYNTKYPGNSFVFIDKAVSNSIGEVEMTIASEENDFSKLPLWASMLGSIDPDHIAKHPDTDTLITEKITVPTTTLNELVNDSGMTEIDLLVVDVEGHDFQILIAYSFLIAPKKIIFEHKHMKSGDLSILMFRLMAKGYTQVGQTELDLILELSK